MNRNKTKAAKNLLSKEGELYYWPNFLQPQSAEEQFEHFLKEIPWESQQITLFGKKHRQPRLISWHGEAAYQYSGLKLSPKPWTTELLALKDQLQQELDLSFNSVLLNLYRDQKDSNGWHADDEKELGLSPWIASVSLGEPRDFLVKHKGDKESLLKIKLESGSLLLMGGSMQSHWKHCLPKRTGALGPRINLTFRWICS